MVKNLRKKAKIKISGMSCVSCAKTIENSLENLDGVTKAQVNLGTEEATVEYDSQKLKFSQPENAVEDAGYEVINEKVVIKIGGMTCAMCVKAIEDVLNKFDGISDVNVNLSI